MNKSDFDRDGIEWVAVEARMHQVLRPLARRLARAGQVPPPRSALRAAEQARRLLSQALRLADRPDLFPGVAAGGRGRKGGTDALTEPLPFGDATAEAEQDAVSPAPRTDSRQPSEQHSARRRGFGSIKISALDPAVRSQLVLEHGSTYVVINSQYPLFVERGGDVLYQLETAVREVCATIDGLTVADYERRINEVLAQAFRLRQRRKRPRGRGRSKQLDLVD